MIVHGVTITDACDTQNVLKKRNFDKKKYFEKKSIKISDMFRKNRASRSVEKFCEFNLNGEMCQKIKMIYLKMITKFNTNELHVEVGTNPSGVVMFGKKLPSFDKKLSGKSTIKPITFSRAAISESRLPSILRSLMFAEPQIT
ncbi:hypothetical protein BpHYR1_020742 [Brachionus plicatilis]|uniref:Uncharacterized protein n=1 Tax=Brachionus plicatilis TaxID=10195 RepID=A0A3M7QE77_BRAPC|nr:hypothetical protein BpHYR1_020742 [Brachionus plicatilis]